MCTPWHKYKLLNSSDDPKDIPSVAASKKPEPDRRICKCQDSVLKDLEEKGELPELHLRFGPLYRKDESGASGRKAFEKSGDRDEAWDKVLEKAGDKVWEKSGDREAWDKVLEKSGDREAWDKVLEAWDKVLEKSREARDEVLEKSGGREAWDEVLEEVKNETMENYLLATRRIEERARSAYADDGGVLHNLTEYKFRWMMIKDGCFFLQLALFILGASSEQLGYPDSHFIFGKEKKEEDVKKWIEAMFFVGNQIPLVVLKEFMKQRFFQDILKEVNWETPSQLPKRILYDLLVKPAIKHDTNQTVTSSKPRGEEQQTTDLLHALHSFMLGPGGSSSNVNRVEDDTGDADLEASRGIHWVVNLVEDDRGEASRGVLGVINLVEDDTGGVAVEASRGVHRAKDSTLSAFELYKKGIHFRKMEEVGCTKISFKKHYNFFPVLYLPVFTVDDRTVVFKSLKYYEGSQQLRKSKCEVTSYLQFMSDLICTYEDVKLLAKHGIIKTDNPYYKEKLPTILSNLAGKDKVTTPNILHLRMKLRDYNMAPWERFKIVAILIFVFTFIQAAFSVIAYFRPPHEK